MFAPYSRPQPDMTFRVVKFSDVPEERREGIIALSGLEEDEI